jgi:hypothetical protein
MGEREKGGRRKEEGGRRKEEGGRMYYKFEQFPGQMQWVVGAGSASA